MKRILVVTSLTALTILSATTACAQESPATTEISTATLDESVQPNEEKERVKRDTRLRVNNEGFAGVEVTKKFEIPEHYGWVKVWVKNEGKKEIKVSVEKDNNGGQKMFETVPPGDSWTGYAEKPFSTGDHFVQVTSDEAEMQGHMSVKIGNDKEQL
ncbi:hypothetical protein [Paenibacillus popilliae]|nr:hypothetical protein [Paenibacillus popilliae]